MRQQSIYLYKPALHAIGAGRRGVQVYPAG